MVNLIYQHNYIGILHFMATINFDSLSHFYHRQPGLPGLSPGMSWLLPSTLVLLWDFNHACQMQKRIDSVEQLPPQQQQKQSQAPFGSIATPTIRHQLTTSQATANQQTKFGKINSTFT